MLIALGLPIGCPGLALGCLLPAVILLVMPTACIGVVVYDESTRAPTANERTLAGFLQARASEVAFAEIIGEGEAASLLVFISADTMIPASGPPAYRFARDGTLVDWALETGEGTPIDRARWGGARRAVTLAQARAWIDARRK